MNKILCLLLILVAPALFAQENADAVFEKITKEYTLNKDGSVELHFYKKLKLLTHFSFNRMYGETFIVYNPEHQNLKINFCKTTHKDGKVTAAPFNAYNEVLPFSAKDAPYFNHLREMVVTHPGTEVDAILELDYTLTSKAGYLPGLMADEVLTESSPVTNKEIIVKVPKGKKLNYKVFGLRTSPQISEGGKFDVYTFKFNGLKAGSHESHQPTESTHLPRLALSSLNWQEAQHFLYDQPIWDFKCNKEMVALVKRLKEENTSDLDFVLAVQKLVAKEVNHYHVSFAEAAYRARPPIEVWKSNGGTSLEKALLLTALIREGGINAEVVMETGSKLFDENIGCLDLLDEVYVQVNPRDREQMFVSPNKEAAQNAIFELNGKTLIMLKPGTYNTIVVNEPFENKVITNGNLILDDSLKMSGEIEALVTEGANPFYKVHADSSFVRTGISGIAAKEVMDWEVMNTAQFRTLADLTFEAKKPLKNQKDYFFLDLPENKAGTPSWHISYLNSERTDPFEIPEVINEQYSFEISLPERVTLVNPLEMIEMKTGFGELVLSVKENKNKITVKRMLKLNKTEIFPTEYPEFKEMMDLWNEVKFRRLVLKR